VSPEFGFLNVRPRPSTARPPIAQVDDGAVLKALEPEVNVRAKVGQKDQWLYVRTPDGIKGYVAAWYLRLPEEAVEAGVQVKVVSPEFGYLNVRPIPSTARPPIAQVDDGTTLGALEPEADARAKVGQEGQWLHIRTPAGVEGYVASVYLRLPEETVKAGIQVDVASPEVGYLNVRPSPSTARPPITRVDDGTVLESLEPEENTRTKVGQENQWLYVRTPDNIEGYVAALYLRLHEEGEEEAGVGRPISHLVVHRDNIGSTQRPKEGGGQGRKGPVAQGPHPQPARGIRERPVRAGQALGRQTQAGERRCLARWGVRLDLWLSRRWRHHPRRLSFPLPGQGQDRLGALHRGDRG